MERVCLCFSASVYSAGWYRVCIPRRWLPVVCTSYTYPAGSEDLVVLAVMDCWRERFNIRLTGITGLKLGLGLRGRGNALVENGKKRNDPTDKPELWRCVCVWDVQCKETSHSSCDATGTKKTGPLMSQCRKNDPITFIKNVRTLPAIRPALLWGQVHLCVCVSRSHSALRVCGHFPCRKLS